MSNLHPRCQRCERLLLASLLIARTGDRRVKHHRGNPADILQYQWRCRRCGHVWWSPYQRVEIRRGFRP